VPETPVITKDDVTVAAGIFTTQLDFGPAAFDAGARWIEVSVKPGTGGSYVTLSPRQPVTPVPQAIYAREAGGLAVPATSEGNSDDNALLDLNQQGADSVLVAARGFAGDEVAAAVRAANAGGGAAIEGTSTFVSGIGVHGVASGSTGIGGLFSGKTGVKASALDAGSVALEVEGALRSTGANKFAFVHTVSAANSFDNVTWLSGTPADGNPDAVVVVSQVVSGAAIPQVTPTPTATGTPVATPTSAPGPGVGLSAPPVAVTYIPAEGVQGAPNGAKGKWAIVRTDSNTPIPVGTKFNVIVVKQ
jgi:hypothetical protein